MSLFPIKSPREFQRFLYSRKLSKRFREFFTLRKFISRKFLQIKQIKDLI